MFERSRRLFAFVLALSMICAACAPTAAPEKQAASKAPAATTELKAGPDKVAEAKPAAEAKPPASAKPLQRATVRMGSITGTPDRALFVGLERGFYDEQGIDLDLQPFRTTLEMIPALATSRLDAGHGGSYPGFFNAFVTGIDFKVVSGVSMNRPPGPGIKNGQWLLVRKDLADQVRGVADLRGKKIAVHAVGSTGDQLLEKIMRYHGLELRDVEVEGVPFPDQLTALGNKAIDAALAIEPMVTLAQDRGIAVPIFETAQAAPNHVNQWLFFSADFVKSQPEVGRRFMVAYVKSLRYAEDAWLKGLNRDDVVQIYIKHTPVKDTRLYERVGATYSETNGRVSLAVLEDDQDFFFRQGLLKQKIDPKIMVDTSFAEHALQVLGPYRE
jgi:NitT/TauT family transport system substrate-binding protein